MTTDFDNVQLVGKDQDVGFDWRTISPESLLANTKYEELHERQRARQAVLNNNETLQGEEFWIELRRIDNENDEDEKNTLTRLQQGEYRYYGKYKDLEEEKVNLDPLMYEICTEFNRLPFIVHQSDTGHTDPVTGEIIDDFVPAVVFVSGRDLTESEDAVQWDFLSSIPELDIAICERLGVTPYNILDLRGATYDDEKSRPVEMSVAETLVGGGGVELIFKH